MKVFDLQCDQGHVFEGWFSSREGFDQQIAQGLLHCPICNSAAIERKLSASRINTGAVKKDESKVGLDKAKDSSQQVAAVQSHVLQHLRAMVRQSENVGPRFAQEAKRMHEGEIEQRAIRGQATAQECKELLEEGVAVMPIPDFLDDDRMQ